MIPKVIHYCWFGGKPLPESAKKCIASWRKFCPDYEIKEWNETNVDVTGSDYIREAYEEKAWAFVPDMVRLQVIYEHGGIYLDTDVEMIRSFDNLMEAPAFMGIDGEVVALGLGFGAESHHPFIGELLDDYKHRHFKKPDGTVDLTPSPTCQSPIFLKHGFSGKDEKQIVDGVIVYPSEFFCPKSFKTGILSLTGNTYSIHHFDGSWLTDGQKRHIRIRHSFYQKLGGCAAPVRQVIEIILRVRRIFLGAVPRVVSKIKVRIRSMRNAL